jgi:chromosome partitioning protein
MPEPAKLCVSNQKGGVGKTTVAINVAGALNARGRDVLFVDLDPQGNATEGLGLVDEYESSPPSLFDVLTDPEERTTIADLVVEHAEMDVIPSNIDMTAVEPELALEHVEDEYDYVIVDCPPHLGYLADNALFATRNVLIPALAESTSKRALELLFDHIESLELDYEIDITDRCVVANRVEETNEAKEMMDWFHQAFPDIPVWEVRKRVALQRAFTDGHSVVEYNPDLDMATVFDEVAADLDEQFGFTEVPA